MDFGHEWTNCFKIDDDEYLPESTYWWHIMPCVAISATTLCWCRFCHMGASRSVNAQGQFVRDRMSEPYELGRPKIKTWKRNRKRKEKKGKGTKEEAACSTFLGRHTPFFLLECHCRLVLGLWFVSWSVCFKIPHLSLHT